MSNGFEETLDYAASIIESSNYDIKTKTEQLDKIAALEETSVELPYINADVVWRIATLAKERAQALSKPIVIDITASSGQVFFHLATKDGTIVDNDYWVNRKKKTVLRFGKSSFYMGRKCKVRGGGISDILNVDDKEYAVHGGSVPIRLTNIDGLWGALTISGLAQIDDHKFALNLLGTIKEQLENP